MAAQASAQPTNMSEVGRIAGVVWSPGAAFQDIAARPHWWAPLLISILLSLTFTYAFTQRVGWERFMRQQIETNSRTQDMPADQREQIIAQQAKYAPIFGYVAGAIGIPLFAALVAGVFLFVFRTIMGAELSFRQAFAIVCYAFIPLTISAVLSLTVMFLKNPEDFDLQYPTLTNIGAFLDPLNTPKWLLSLGSSIDVFTLWILALLATGFAVAARRISWSSSMACVGGIWGVYVLFKMGWAAMFG